MRAKKARDYSEGERVVLLTNKVRGVPLYAVGWIEEVHSNPYGWGYLTINFDDYLVEPVVLGARDVVSEGGLDEEDVERFYRAGLDIQTRRSEEYRRLREAKKEATVPYWAAWSNFQHRVWTRSHERAEEVAEGEEEMDTFRLGSLLDRLEPVEVEFTAEEAEAITKYKLLERQRKRLLREGRKPYEEYLREDE